MKQLLWGSLGIGAIFLLLVIQDRAKTAANVSGSATGSPAYLEIPSAGIYSRIESTGVTPNGAMGVPDDPSVVDWFELGVHPGEIGTAVIDGHYGFKAGKAAAFDSLHTINQGDKIYVHDRKGHTTIFVVQRQKIYNLDDATTEIFSSNDGKAHLNLITCEGVWDKNLRKYSGRLVVFADKE